jgi:serine phosphatase RsbU (regulator of sigma subunit)/pSer/pThr/pTyr-binding forkhead associated (FHA) protein
MAFLMKMTGEPPGQLFELRDDETVIGRLPECAIVLDPNGVSRRHAVIRREGQNFALVDLESRNKTKLNEREIPPKQEQVLKSGDRINICDVEMIFYVAMPVPVQATTEVVEVTEGTDDSAMHNLDASQADMLACSIRPEAKLKAILEITRNLSSSLKLDIVAPKILDSLLDVFPQAERVFLVLLKDGTDKRAIRQTFHKVRPYKRAGVKAPLGKPSAEESRLTISRTIMKTVLDLRKAVLSQDAGNDSNLPTSASIADLRIRSFMCAPLLTPDDGAPLGILQIDTTDRRQFSQDDLDMLVAVAGQASIAIQNASLHEGLLARERIERDLRLAEQVQRRFLPQSEPTVPGYEFYAHYHPAFEVGGDYYDFVHLDGDHWAVAVGDVSGKGVAAALMMAKFSGDTRLCITTKGCPAAAADQLNETLCAAGIEEKFITMSLSVLEPAENRLTFCSAGHFPMMIRRANGEVEELGGDISGFPLGIMPNLTYEKMATILAPGDVVIIYSDGVTDARSPKEELYDSQENRRLRKRVVESSGSPRAVGRSIMQEIREFSAGRHQADDITLVCFGPVAQSPSE